MKTLHGLTEAQMWEVYEFCRAENWQRFIEEITYDRDDCINLGEGDFGEIAINALEIWDRSDRRADLEFVIADKAIYDWLVAYNEED